MPVAARRPIADGWRPFDNPALSRRGPVSSASFRRSCRGAYLSRLELYGRLNHLHRRWSVVVSARPAFRTRGSHLGTVQNRRSVLLRKFAGLRRGLGLWAVGMYSRSPSSMEAGIPQAATGTAALTTQPATPRLSATESCSVGTRTRLGTRRSGSGLPRLAASRGIPAANQVAHQHRDQGDRQYRGGHRRRRSWVKRAVTAISPPASSVNTPG